MTYKYKWKDFIENELKGSPFKNLSELKDYYKESFESNKREVKALIEQELESLLKESFAVNIYEDFISVYYSSLSLPDKVFVMPCNYYGLQVDSEFIYGTPEEVIPYIIYFTLQKNATKFAQLGLYYIPPKNNRTFNYEKIIVKESLEDCYKELFSSVITAWPHLDKSKNDKDRTEELKNLLNYSERFVIHESLTPKEDRFETFFKNATELNFTNRVKIHSPYK